MCLPRSWTNRCRWTAPPQVVALLCRSFNVVRGLLGRCPSPAHRRLVSLYVYVLLRNKTAPIAHTWYWFVLRGCASQPTISWCVRHIFQPLATSAEETAGAADIDNATLSGRRLYAIMLPLFCARVKRQYSCLHDRRHRAGGGSGGGPVLLENTTVVAQMCCVQTKLMAVKCRRPPRGRGTLLCCS